MCSRLWEMLEELWEQIGSGNALELAPARQQTSKQKKITKKKQTSKQEQAAKPKTKRQPQPEQKKKDAEKPETDIRDLMDGMSPEDIDMSQIGTHHRSKQDMLDELRSIYL